MTTQPNYPTELPEKFVWNIFCLWVKGNMSAVAKETWACPSCCHDPQAAEEVEAQRCEEDCWEGSQAEWQQ
jgi:hypothetical protein